MDAYLRGLEYDSLETLCRDLAQVVKTGSSELQLGRAVCKLFKRFNLGGEKLPPDHAGYYELMLKIVNHLPEEWRDWIDEAVDKAVETEQQTKKIFREVEKSLQVSALRNTRVFTQMLPCRIRPAMKACYQDEVGKRTHGRSPGQAMTAARIRCGRTSNKIGPLAAPGRLDAKQVRGLAGLDAAPKPDDRMDLYRRRLSCLPTRRLSSTCNSILPRRSSGLSCPHPGRNDLAIFEASPSPLWCGSRDQIAHPRN